jgi:anaerobic ribonucleoside-triphosphate reductase activating protein
MGNVGIYRKSLKLNLAAELPSSVVNGPGLRYVIWVQGCSLKCQGCFNEDFQPFIDKNITTVEELAVRILSTKGIEGVTYSGGEPTLQAEALVGLSEILKENNLTIICYTGFTLDELQKHGDTHTKKLLKMIDILIDGPYVKENSANLMWRGSTNQKVHFLTDIYKQHEKKINVNSSEIELFIGNDKMITTGILNAEILQRLDQILAGK